MDFLIRRYDHDAFQKLGEARPILTVRSEIGPYRRPSQRYVIRKNDTRVHEQKLLEQVTEQQVFVNANGPRFRPAKYKDLKLGLGAALIG
jgi:hypothetical protein